MRRDEFADPKKLAGRVQTCSFCFAQIPDQDIDWVPGAHDEAGWAHLAKLHNHNGTSPCQWVATRNFTRSA